MEHINKNRSSSSCIREGYRLYRGNLRNIFVTSWRELAATSLLFAGLVTCMAYGKPMAAVAALGCCLAVAFVLFKARVFDMLDYRPYLWNIRRMCLVALIALMAAALVVAPLLLTTLAAAPPLWLRAVAAALSLIVAAAALPLLHVGLDLMMSERPHALRAYRTGLRRWGFVFLTVFLSSLVCAVVFAVVCAPLAIALHSATANEAGIALGDPDGLPAWFPWLLFATAAVTCHATLYIQTWQTFAMAFAYGSISYKKEQQ